MDLNDKALSSVFIGSPTDGRPPKLISSVAQVAERASTIFSKRELERELRKRDELLKEMMSFLSSMRGGLKTIGRHMIRALCG